MGTRDEALDTLRKAYSRGELSLYLGAGVSVGNGLPTWEKLVLAMYFSALSKQSLGQWVPFPNYLFAIAEWHMDRGHEPLEITARRIRTYYENEQDFLQHLRETLYAGFIDVEDGSYTYVDPGALRYANQTLDATLKLCEKQVEGRRGVKSVITYNYDSLFEISLDNTPFQSVCRAEPLEPEKLPVYHVHGYVPLEGEGSHPDEVVFTEEQYHFASQDAYSWSNLVQIQCMSASTGLMIGLSLSDRNMRRLLDAVSKTPIETRNYALLQQPQWERPGDIELEQIDHKAREYFERFATSGVKSRFDYGPGIKGPTWQMQIIGIVDEVRRVDVEQQTSILEQLGIEPVWYSNHDEIPDILATIAGE